MNSLLWFSQKSNQEKVDIGAKWWLFHSKRDNYRSIQLESKFASGSILASLEVFYQLNEKMANEKYGINS